MTERADFLVNNRSPRYLHGFQKDTNETTELPHTVPVDNQVTYIDSFTNYGVDTVYGQEYVLAASEGSDPRIQDALNLATHVEITAKKYHGIFWDDDTSAYETTISYNVSTRTLTIAPTAGSFRVYIDGAIHVYYGPQSITHAATEGGWFFYYNSSGVLTASQTAWSLLADVPVAFLYYDATTPDYILLEERHHHEADKEWHNSQHFAMGTFVKRGTDFVLGNYAIGVSSDAAVTWSLGSGTVVDEDINTAVSAVPDGGPYQTWYKSGASGAWRRTQRTIPYHFNAGTNWIQYNQLAGGSWQLTDLGNNQFTNYYIFGVPATESSKQIIVIPSQQVYATETLADNEGLSDLDLTGFPSQEFVGVWKLVMRADTGGGATGRAQIRKVTRLVGARTASFAGGTAPTVHNSLSGRSDADTHPASSITNTPAGNIAATTVQAAINELDSEKAQLAAALTNQRVPFANASGFLTDNSNFYYETGTGLRITDSTLATSTTSGALVVTGGIATGDGLYAGGRITGAAAASSTGAILARPPETTLASGTIAAFRADLLANPASASSAINIGGYFAASTASDNTQDFTSSVGLSGFYMSVIHNGAGTVTGENGIVALVDNRGSGTVTDLAVARLTARNLGTGTITRSYGVRVTSLVSSGGGTVGTNYGIFVEGQTAGTVNYSIYTNAGLVRLGGQTSIADTTASTSTTTGALVVTGGVGCGDYFTGKYRSSDGTTGLTATRTFYAASSSGGATNVLNTVTIKDGIITSWTQA